MIPLASGGIEITLMIDPLGMVTTRSAGPPPSIASVARSSLNRFPVSLPARRKVSPCMPGTERTAKLSDSTEVPIITACMTISS